MTICSIHILFFKMPSSSEEWEKIADEYFVKWNFPNCLGALDGKHVTIRCPRNSSSMNYNYKNTFSIVLLALADANYKLIHVDVGCKGRISDGGVFNRCTLYNAIENNILSESHHRNVFLKLTSLHLLLSLPMMRLHSKHI